MSHLSLESLARLLDEEPSSSESGHLEGCTTCRAELASLRADRLALAELPDLLPPPAGAWTALAGRLRDEGLLRATPAPTRRTGSRLLRLAAALALFLTGSVAGFLARGAGETGMGAAEVRAGAGTATRPAVGSSLTSASSLSGTPLGPVQVTARGSTRTTTNHRDAAAAARALEEAEVAYRAALARYAEFATEDLATNRLARLAALENIVITTRDALAAAPADPLINGYHMAALAQRDATVRQIALSDNDRWY